jgi:hypothetical protein
MNLTWRYIFMLFDNLGYYCYSAHTSTKPNKNYSNTKMNLGLSLVLPSRWMEFSERQDCKKMAGKSEGEVYKMSQCPVHSI